MSADVHQRFVSEVVGTTVGGRYLVERVLGAGGMGVVTAGRHPELDQPVAIKFMWPEHAADDALAKRFMREAKVAAKVHSTHLVRVFDVGRLDSGVPYLVMEMLSGRDLDVELEEREVPLSESLDWFLQSLVGLAEIHAAGIVHRDLKPSNLFLADTPSGRIVKVLDFGISKDTKTQSAEGITSTASLLGTPHYMSPEQVRSSKNVDVRSDIWTLGVILYELATGKLPFRGSANSDGYGEIFGLILFREPERPSKLKPGVPPELENIILKCLAKEPGERYQTVSALATALRPLVGDHSQHRIESIRRTVPDGDFVLAEPPQSSSPMVAAAATVHEGRSGPSLSPAVPVRSEREPREPVPHTGAALAKAVTQPEKSTAIKWIGAMFALALLISVAAVIRTVTASNSTTAAPAADRLVEPTPSHEVPVPTAIAPLAASSNSNANGNGPESPTNRAGVTPGPTAPHPSSRPAAMGGAKRNAPAGSGRPTTGAAAPPQDAPLILDRK